MTLLNDCLNATDGAACASAWNSLNWAGGVDWENMDYGAASRLAEKLGIDANKSVDDVVKGLGGSVSETVKIALQGIKNRVYPSSVQRPVAPSGKRGAVPRRVPVVPGGLFVVMNGGGVTSYGNFVRKVDALKFNISMYGGGQHTAAMVRASLRELESLLNKEGKSIEVNDRARINDAIDSLERSEKRVVKAGEYINILTQAIKEARLSAKDSKFTDTTALEVIQELAEQQRKSKEAATKKGLGLTELLSSLQSALTEVKGVIAAAKPLST
jgi:hypothetical protein